ncbi:MAG: hypothetical protein ABIF45_06625 [Pseudomonadota bacterium]
MPSEIAISIFITIADAAMDVVIGAMTIANIASAAMKTEMAETRLINERWHDGVGKASQFRVNVSNGLDLRGCTNPPMAIEPGQVGATIKRRVLGAEALSIMIRDGRRLDTDTHE